MKLILLILFMFASMSYAGDYVIIVNKDNPLPSISKTQLNRLYTGKIKDVNGTQLVPIDQSVDQAITTSFLNDVLGMIPAEYKEFWVAQQVKGFGTAPMIQRTSSMVKAIISQIPGAIGYISSGDIDDSVKKIEVK